MVKIVDLKVWNAGWVSQVAPGLLLGLVPGSMWVKIGFRLNTFTPHLLPSSCCIAQ